MTALARLLSIADLRREAKRRLPKSVFEFIDGGAEDELTLADNRAAFERTRLVPRVLVDVARPEPAVDIVGKAAAAPFVVAPMGSCMLAWPGADLAIAKAAAHHGIPYTLSTMATTSIEDMARAVQGRLWFQLYVLNKREFTLGLVDRAKAAGYETLVVTVDLPVAGNRERDLRNGLSVPIRFTPRHVLEGITHPGWAWRLLAGGLPQFENVRGLLDEKDAGMTIAARVGRSLDAGFDWDALARVRERWPGKLLLKGVEHPEDAKRLVAEGYDGIWISNHGGRQLDGAIAPADALPAIAQAVGGRVPLIVDSGVRRGVDALKVRALGGEAVAVGRAALFGAACGGEAGARHALGILIGELKRAMQLAGVAMLADADASLLAPAR